MEIYEATAMAYKNGYERGKQESVKHAWWKKKWHDNDMIGHMYEECPICGCIISDTEKFWDCNYCPNCGTCMSAEEPCTAEHLKAIISEMESGCGDSRG